ncbi:TetR/AcrR family transcriptional regulator [Gordonia sp. DT30]|uniref:TetR/AcrR family transcriptional regulator n=1 Tax=unclassified Gordonia (in: high G+C Gram-positive bacteria) TaxID=2657482 RepID=UPI003CF3CD60
MTQHRGNRYGRSEDARAKVLHSADDLLAEVGFAALTMEGIARRAGVAKQTIYRWWPTKADVLLEALITDADKRLTMPDTGALAGDVRAAVQLLAALMADPEEGKLLRALQSHSELDPGFAAKFESAFLVGHRERENAPLRRAIDRGELPLDIDLTLARATLYGPVYALPVDQLTPDRVRAIADRWLAAVGVRPK